MVCNIRFIIPILLFAGAKQIFGNNFEEINIKNKIKSIFQSGNDDIKGRLLTPEEGCGLTKVKNTRIVGGTEAPIGERINRTFARI